MKALLWVGVAMLVLWAVLWLGVKLAVGAIHALLLLGVVFVVIGWVQGKRLVSRRAP